MRIYKLYKKMCPHDCKVNAFYKKPLKKPTKNCWFTLMPLGHTTWSVTCVKKQELDIKPTIPCVQRLRPRLYQSGVDELLMMERTGHKSLDGVRSYKRTSREQQMGLSRIINGSSSISTSIAQQSTCQQGPNRPSLFKVVAMSRSISLMMD